MHRRGSQQTVTAGRHTHDTNKGSTPMECDDAPVPIVNQMGKRKIHARIEAPTVETVTTGCKRIKLVNSLNRCETVHVPNVGGAKDMVSIMEYILITMKERIVYMCHSFD